jgi:hypothetical protein
LAAEISGGARAERVEENCGKSRAHIAKSRLGIWFSQHGWGGKSWQEQSTQSKIAVGNLILATRLGIWLKNQFFQPDIFSDPGKDLSVSIGMEPHVEQHYDDINFFSQHPQFDATPTASSHGNVRGYGLSGYTGLDLKSMAFS